MTKKLTFLSIIVPLFSCWQGQLLMAQSTPRQGSVRSFGAFDTRRAAHPDLSYPATEVGGAGNQADADALSPAKTKVYKFRSVDYPGGTDTYLHDYDAGTAVGDFDYPNVDLPFYLSGTSYHLLNIPGVTIDTINGINSSRQMVGPYQDSAGHSHGFVYDGKSIVTIDAPGATDTYAWEISDSGLIAGFYYNSNGVAHGFLDKNGAFSKIDFPHSSATYATGVNSSGEIVGYYNDSQGGAHGFLLSNGAYSSLDFPLAKATFAYGINDAGTIVGSYDAGAEHGFTYAGGVFTMADVPGAAATVLLRVKNNQNVVGYLTDSLGEVHGFIGK